MVEGINVALYEENTLVACFCKYCNKFICTGRTYFPNNKPFGHVSMDSAKFRRSDGYKHACAMNEHLTKVEFTDFWFKLLL